LFSFELSADEMSKIDATDRGNGIAWGAEDPLNFR